MDTKNKCCCFTGHRYMKTEYKDILPERLDNIIRRLYDDGIRDFITGGALGFDTYAANAVLRLRDSGAEARLILALPCRSQTKGWHMNDKLVYLDILSRADEVIYVSEEYTPECMHKRNRFMIDNSAHCVFFITQMRGGTAYTVKYALENDTTLHNVMTD